MVQVESSHSPELWKRLLHLNLRDCCETCAKETEFVLIYKTIKNSSIKKSVCWWNVLDPSLEVKKGRLKREWVLIYSLYILTKEANCSQCDLMSCPYEDLWCFLRMMSCIKCLFPFLTCYVNIIFKVPLRKVTSSCDHISVSARTFLGPSPALSFKW